VDQLSISIPLLKLRGAKILFYCHFPDQLLAVPGSWLKKLYRVPVDLLEEITTGHSTQFDSLLTSHLFFVFFLDNFFFSFFLVSCMQFKREKEEDRRNEDEMAKTESKDK